MIHEIKSSEKDGQQSSDRADIQRPSLENSLQDSAQSNRDDRHRQMSENKQDPYQNKSIKKKKSAENQKKPKTPQGSPKKEPRSQSKKRDSEKKIQDQKKDSYDDLKVNENEDESSYDGSEQSIKEEGDDVKKKMKKNHTYSQFQKHQTKVLQKWFLDNIQHPYLRKIDKAILAEQTGLSKKQITGWFTNNRKRKYQKVVAAAKKKNKGYNYVREIVKMMFDKDFDQSLTSDNESSIVLDKKGKISNRFEDTPQFQSANVTDQRIDQKSQSISDKMAGGLPFNASFKLNENNNFSLYENSQISQQMVQQDSLKLNNFGMGIGSQRQSHYVAGSVVTDYTKNTSVVQQEQTPEQGFQLNLQSDVKQNLVSTCNQSPLQTVFPHQYDSSRRTPQQKREEKQGEKNCHIQKTIQEIIDQNGKNLPKYALEKLENLRKKQKIIHTQDPKIIKQASDGNIMQSNGIGPLISSGNAKSGFQPIHTQHNQLNRERSLRELHRVQQKQQPQQKQQNIGAVFPPTDVKYIPILYTKCPIGKESHYEPLFDLKHQIKFYLNFLEIDSKQGNGSSCQQQAQFIESDHRQNQINKIEQYIQKVGKGIFQQNDSQISKFMQQMNAYQDQQMQMNNLQVNQSASQASQSLPGTSGIKTSTSQGNSQDNNKIQRTESLVASADSLKTPTPLQRQINQKKLASMEQSELFLSQIQKLLMDTLVSFQNIGDPDKLNEFLSNIQNMQSMIQSNSQNGRITTKSGEQKLVDQQNLQMANQKNPNLMNNSNLNSLNSGGAGSVNLGYPSSDSNQYNSNQNSNNIANSNVNSNSYYNKKSKDSNEDLNDNQYTDIKQSKSQHVEIGQKAHQNRDSPTQFGTEKPATQNQIANMSKMQNSAVDALKKSLSSVMNGTKGSIQTSLQQKGVDGLDKLNDINDQMKHQANKIKQSLFALQQINNIIQTLVTMNSNSVCSGQQMQQAQQTQQNQHQQQQQQQQQVGQQSCSVQNNSIAIMQNNSKMPSPPGGPINYNTARKNSQISSLNNALLNNENQKHQFNKDQSNSPIEQDFNMIGGFIDTNFLSTFNNNFINQFQSNINQNSQPIGPNRLPPSQFAPNYQANQQTSQYQQLFSKNMDMINFQNNPESNQVDGQFNHSSPPNLQNMQNINQQYLMNQQYLNQGQNSYRSYNGQNSGAQSQNDLRGGQVPQSVKGTSQISQNQSQFNQLQQIQLNQFNLLRQQQNNEFNIPISHQTQNGGESVSNNNNNNNQQTQMQDNQINGGPLANDTNSLDYLTNFYQNNGQNNNNFMM